MQAVPDDDEQTEQENNRFVIMLTGCLCNLFY